MPENIELFEIWIHFKISNWVFIPEAAAPRPHAGPGDTLLLIPFRDTLSIPKKNPCKAYVLDLLIDDATEVKQNFISYFLTDYCYS